MTDKKITDIKDARAARSRRQAAAQYGKEYASIIEYVAKFINGTNDDNLATTFFAEDWVQILEFALCLENEQLIALSKEKIQSRIQSIEDINQRLETCAYVHDFAIDNESDGFEDIIYFVLRQMENIKMDLDSWIETLLEYDQEDLLCDDVTLILLDKIAESLVSERIKYKDLTEWIGDVYSFICASRHDYIISEKDFPEINIEDYDTIFRVCPAESPNIIKIIDRFNQTNHTVQKLYELLTTFTYVPAMKKATLIKLSNMGHEKLKQSN